jgi:hypothetical protein
VRTRRRDGPRPTRLRDRQAEALAKAVLHDDDAGALQRVDAECVLERVYHWQLDDLDVARDVARELVVQALELLEHLEGLRVVAHAARVRAREHEHAGVDHLLVALPIVRAHAQVRRRGGIIAGVAAGVAAAGRSVKLREEQRLAALRRRSGCGVGGSGVRQA